MDNKRLSLILGIITVVLWASLATFSRILMHMPPFYQLGVCFFLGGLLSLRKFKEVFQGWKVFLWGSLGYFGYHFFLFYALRYAPAVEANLINYLWPLIMVMLTPVFFKENTLKFYHYLGGVLAIIGCIVMVSGQDIRFEYDSLKGYGLAFAAAWTWPIFSLGKRKLPPTSVWAIGGFCFGAGLLCFATHSAIEPGVYLTQKDFFVLLMMGLGPFGIAFYTWDKAMELGDPRQIGALTYLTPVLSTLGLVLFAGEALSSRTLVAMVLIIGGASTGLLDLFSGKIVKR